MKESGLLEALRVPLTPCRSKKNKVSVCCESNKKERLVNKKKQEIEFQEYEYYDDTDSKTLDYRTGRNPLFWSIRMPELA